MSKQVRIGDITIGGGNPIAIQSMCNVDPHDEKGLIEQISALTDSGCQIVRLTVPDNEAAEVFGSVKKKLVQGGNRVPLVADIHFDYRLAIAAIEHGADKIRINPGNIGSRGNLEKVVRAAKEREIPIRVGVNAGSLEKELLDRLGVCPEALCESALRNVAAIEELGYDKLVVSIKCSDLQLCVKAYELFAEKSAYPLHVGITETGPVKDGIIKSAMGLGLLFDKGLGDTLRVSLTTDPAEEVTVAKKILQFAGLRKFGVEIISCPTCARTNIDIISLAEQAEKALSHIQKPLKVAVMGCAVNGPGEAREADFGIAGGNGEALLFSRGEVLRKVPESEVIAALAELAEQYQ